MNALHDGLKNFKMLGVPCNQFGLQEQGANGTEIMNSLQYVRPGGGFVPNFQLTEKMEVNGPNEHPMFTYMKKYCPAPWKSYAPVSKLYYEGLTTTDIRWNFEKFLIDSEGRPVMRYSTEYQPEDILADIQQLLMVDQQEDKRR
jgi:glutathione peroxidase